MKRILFILMISVLLLTGCAKKAPKPIDLPEKPNNTGEKVVFYMCEKGNFPISFTVDGTQQIENGTYWYYELQGAFDYKQDEVFYIYDSSTMQPIETAQFADLGNQDGYATNGGWPLFMTPVHTEYGDANQDLVDEQLVTLAKQQLSANNLENARVQITDVWACDMDADETPEQFFKACNCALSAEERKESYCFLGYTDGESCQVLYGYYSPQTDATEKQVKTIEPVICDLSGSGTWDVMLHKAGDYESMTTYDFTDGNFSKCYEIIY